MHKIEKLIVINHEDCGAAKIINPKKNFNNSNEIEIHKISFLKIKKIIKKKFPNLKIELNFIKLNKKIKKMNEL